MKTLTLIKLSSASILALSLAACGGSDEDVTVEYNSLSAETGTANVTGISIDPSTKATSSQTLSFDGVADTATINSVSVGLVPDDLRSKATDGSGLSYVSALSNSGGATKLIAVQTVASDMPSRSASFSGHSNISLTTGAGQYSGVMPTTMNATFGSGGGTLDVTMAGLSAGSPTFTPANGVDQSYTSTGSESIVLSDLDISGSSFMAGSSSSVAVSGFGTASSTTTFTTPTISATGVFAGPQAAELAGAATVVDANGRQLLTTFTGSQ